jgi:hypothetical protein
MIDLGLTGKRAVVSGAGMSGWGRECGPESLDGYLNTKAVWIRTQ